MRAPPDPRIVGTARVARAVAPASRRDRPHDHPLTNTRHWTKNERCLDPGLQPHPLCDLQRGRHARSLHALGDPHDGAGPQVAQKALIGPGPRKPARLSTTGRSLWHAHRCGQRRSRSRVDWLPVESRWWRHWLLGKPTASWKSRASGSSAKTSPPALPDTILTGHGSPKPVGRAPISAIRNYF